MQLYWINNKEIKLIIKNKVEILTPDKLITKYGDNKKIMEQIQKLLKNPKNDFLTVYDKILNESRYIEFKDDYKRYSAYEIMIKNIMKTKKYKKGDNISFAMRLKDELDNLEIENYMLEINDDVLHYANIYIVDKQLFVADITNDLIDKEIKLDQTNEICLIPNSIRIPINKYLEDNQVVYVMEPIKDNLKKMNDIKKQSIKSFVINYSLYS